jgi:hypothetical protein
MRVVGLVVLQGLLEITGVVGLALVLARVPFSWRRAFLVGAGLFTVIQIARHLPLFFGFHTLVGLLALTVYLVRGENVSLASSFMAAFLSLFVLGLIEFTSNEAILAMLRIDAQVAAANHETWALIGMPQGVIMVFLTWVASKVIKPLRPGRQNGLSRSK